MANSKKSTCAICGKEYDVCLSCRKDMDLKPWRSITDDIKCYKLFLVLTQYNNGHIKKDEAKKQIDKININLDDLKESVRKNVEEIIADKQISLKSNK